MQPRTSQPKRTLAKDFYASDFTKTLHNGNWSENKLEHYMLDHLESVQSNIPSETKALRAGQFSELSVTHDRLRVDIDCIERRLDYLVESLRVLREDMQVRKTGHKFMEEKFQKRLAEYDRKTALLQEKYAEKHALLSSIFAVGQF